MKQKNRLRITARRFLAVVHGLQRARPWHYTEKLDPQPQVVVALGFLITN